MADVNRAPARPRPLLGAHESIAGGLHRAFDRILAVGGITYSPERMRAAVVAAADGHTPISLIVVNDGRYRTIAPVWTGGLRYPRLERDGTGPGLLDRLLAPRRPAN